MSNPAYDIPKFVSRKLAAGFVQETATGAVNKSLGPQKREGSLAATLEPVGRNQIVDVVRDYRWTVSQFSDDDLKEIPYIQLKEYKVVDASIKRQALFYAKAYVPDAFKSATGQAATSSGVLDVYKELWPNDNPTGFAYKFPYFNKVGFELASEPWTNLDPVGDSIKQGLQGLGDILDARKATDTLGKIGDLISGSANASLNMQYPAVGVVDRPKMFMAHNDRNINISFTLYNTVEEADWSDNRDLVYILMSQNLFNKRDATTGVPPVFYSVFVPGQYFCYAACVTNYKVEYLGNQRLLNWGTDRSFIVPDAYQIDITLTELVKPSKNQLEAMSTGEAEQKVTVLFQ